MKIHKSHRLFFAAAAVVCGMYGQVAQARHAHPHHRDYHSGMYAGFAQSGKASFYRASGMVMAHRTLAKGTPVRVTNLEQNKEVCLHVAGAGPFIKGRIADVSTSAAAQLGFIKQGMTRVRLRVDPSCG